MTEEEMKIELERAYRCISGFYYFHLKGEPPDDIFFGYQSLVIGAAARFVHEDVLDGSEYFIGKNVEVLRKTLNSYYRNRVRGVPVSRDN